MAAKAGSDSLGAQLAFMREVSKKKCMNRECNNTFEGLAIAKYCSDECRFREAYLRRKDKEEG